MKLKEEMLSVCTAIMEAEDNARAWKQEAASRTKRFRELVKAENIAFDTHLNPADVLAEIRRQIIDAPKTFSDELMVISDAESPNNPE